MIKDLLDSINLALMQHPHLLHVMHILFWIKYWLLLGIFGVFVYLVFAEDSARLSADAEKAKDIFIA